MTATAIAFATDSGTDLIARLPGGRAACSAARLQEFGTGRAYRHELDRGGHFASLELAEPLDGKTVSVSFVQLIRIRDGLIAEVREYFSPRIRSELMDRAHSLRP